jgi:hypothetical protein
LDKKLRKLLEEVPWGNIVHIYSRASDFPIQVENILANDNIEVYENILENIEHQDGIQQATPFMLNVLLELLKYNVNKFEILKICQIVWNAVIDFFRWPNRGQLIASTMQGMLDKKYLWPDYIDEYTDEVLWESIFPDNFYDWNFHSLKLFYEYKEQIFYCTKSEEAELRNIADKLYSDITNNKILE